MFKQLRFTCEKNLFMAMSTQVVYGIGERKNSNYTDIAPCPCSCLTWPLLSLSTWIRDYG